jgi:hypothetical protein
MTRAEFIALPYLLTPGQAAACGFSAHTLHKFADNGVLRIIRPAGCTQRRYQKLQFAQLLDWVGALDRSAWARERPLLTSNAVCQWTGYDRGTITRIVTAGGLVCVQPGGLGSRHYRKRDIGEWIGL